MSSSIVCLAARLEIMEERIGSLEREVKLSNLKLSRIEEKLKEQTRQLSMLIDQKVLNEPQKQEQVPQPIEETEKDKDDEQIPVLPVRTVTDLYILNRRCAINEAFLQQMAEKLQQIVFASEKRNRNARRVMETLVTYDVLCQFNWTGRNAKNYLATTKNRFANLHGIIALLVKALSFGLNAEQTEQERSSITNSVRNAVNKSSQNKKRFCQTRNE
ncbi:uncharacterized protein LOC121601936 [Anopheles merus]|uniref:uncharacterized protein LOC121601194 n=1 Tax=Anopheles merus TaxID=30066 RepID=UPI001BE3FEDB|nr:uncharacterized protein LOC121601194 [Anopheles merus]XP_041785933.1 uncharacterized protein LOC121601195 [Anopheles merus]XP_041786543.1 uncharacterized protein LOC121601814 [Anopheles merus]XP_041786667.1 uncharacterized protein LOC121601936 [Anopheles merus]